MMGSGKSAVGELAAERMQMEFLDSDRSIEKIAGKKISEIFKTDGELHFREMERSFIKSGHPAHGCLVSCGGGLASIEGMADQLKSKGLVICLWANPETIYQRIKDDQNRPLLRVKNPLAEIQKLIEVRKEIYLNADLVIQTDKLTLSQTVDTVISGQNSILED
ncbi:shikimate kinase [Opitutales bacterium]|nr:shikimate kinase [Opitutales bacterium]